MNEYLWQIALNGGAPVEPERLMSDWHEIKCWAETLLRPQNENSGRGE